MKTVSESPAKTLVWDAPVRVFHWLMVLCFSGAYLTAETESWRRLHITLGYTMAGLVVFRLLWGVVGSRYARFSQFVRGPQSVIRYVGSLLKGRPMHYVGHNPAGALAILGLLGLTLAVTASGWALFNDLGGEWLEEAHELLANAMLLLVGIHIAAVVLSSWAHQSNLIGAMINGRKSVRSAEGIRKAHTLVAVLLGLAVLSFWWWQSRPL